MEKRIHMLLLIPMHNILAITLAIYIRTEKLSKWSTFVHATVSESWKIVACNELGSSRQNGNRTEKAPWG